MARSGVEEQIVVEPHEVLDVPVPQRQHFLDEQIDGLVTHPLAVEVPDAAIGAVAPAPAVREHRGHANGSALETEERTDGPAPRKLFDIHQIVGRDHVQVALGRRGLAREVDPGAAGVAVGLIEICARGLAVHGPDKARKCQLGLVKEEQVHHRVVPDGFVEFLAAHEAVGDVHAAQRQRQIGSKSLDLPRNLDRGAVGLREHARQAHQVGLEPFQLFGEGRPPRTREIKVLRRVALPASLENLMVEVEDRHLDSVPAKMARDHGDAVGGMIPVPAAPGRGVVEHRLVALGRDDEKDLSDAPLGKQLGQAVLDQLLEAAVSGSHRHLLHPQIIRLFEHA